MRTRCIVFKFQNDTLAFDRLYGDAKSCRLLKERLEAQGYIDAKTIAKNTKLICFADTANVKEQYFDTLKAFKTKTIAGRKIWVVHR